MRILNALVFDDFISGTTATWLSRSDFNAAIGQADAFAVQAITADVQGVSPTIKVASEHSTDAQNWVSTGMTEIAWSISNDQSLLGWNFFFTGTSGLAANIRFRISLGGTNPKCRLRLHVTGRTF